MDRVTIFDRVNFLLEGEIVSAAGLQRAADRKSWVCPKCGNGSNGGKGDGIRQKEYHGRLIWHCYRCGEHMSNCDVLAASWEISDNATLANRLSEKYPDLRDRNQQNFFLEGENKVMTEKTTGKSYAKMYEIQRRALCDKWQSEFGGAWRGLNYETLKDAGAGYNVKYKSIILPYDDGTYFWRSVEGTGRGINKGGKRRLYITAPIKTGWGKLNFLTEGEIDALTLKQALSPYLANFGVAATGSVGFLQMLIRELDQTYKTCADKPKFIWVGDNDEAGRSGAEKIVSSLNAAGYPAVAIYFADENTSKVDTNKFMQDRGEEALRGFLIDVVDNTGIELSQRVEEIQERVKQEQIAEAKKHGVTICSLSDYFAEGFDTELDKVSTYAGRATGFDNLDLRQIFLPGVYILGGSPGAGKTTFAWQLLSNLAEGDADRLRDAEYCVYCSYEMSRLELASKSIARELRRRRLAGGEVLALSSADIRRGAGRDTDEFKAARAKFLKTAKKLQVAELSNTTLEELLIVLKAEVQKAGDKPVTIAIDYLQLIPVSNPKATAKERVDEIMLALKTFQRATNATLIIISSLNRGANMYGGDKLFSFKESGSIEYSADAVWTLERLEKDKIDNPRLIKFECHKNRNGSTYEVMFDYYAQSDYFCPSKASKLNDMAKPDDEAKKSSKHKR